MLRVKVKRRLFTSNTTWLRSIASSSFIRDTFMDYFIRNHNHNYVKSSSVLPLYDPTVPFVNAGMNQFKGIFLGSCKAPCPRAVNSQKCVRVGGKHNDLDIVGTDGYHHTFFEMLGNWSFGDYYKKEACQMAWNLLLGPYRLKPENLLVTYFSGDAVLGLKEDIECRDIWQSIGVQSSHIKPHGAIDNFWEMGTTGPCGPCTEIYYISADGTLTEIWNLVFIQYNRENNGSITSLPKHHVDTGMGLERMVALMQSVPSNYDTDLFQPIIKAIEKRSKTGPPYSHKFGDSATVDNAYRCLADHARMISVCLADGVFPASSLNLKQVMRKSFKISEDIFQCKTGMLCELYDHVAESLGSVYPELNTKKQEAKTIIEYEESSYAKLRANLKRKWKELVIQYPEVESLKDLELSGFSEGYKQFKQAMTLNKSRTIPGDVVFKLYDTHGFQEDTIENIAKLNNLDIDKNGFETLLKQHKSRHKTSFREQNNLNRAVLFEKFIEMLNKTGVKSTNDEYKYEYYLENGEIKFKSLPTKLVGILNENVEWIDSLKRTNNQNYYLIFENTNFYCEEGGQANDTGNIEIHNSNIFKVDSVFKIKDFVFHKGTFGNHDVNIKINDCALLNIDTDRRLNIMRNHTATHLLNATIRNVLSNSVVCQTGSNVSEKGFSLNLSVYGQKLSQQVIVEAQNVVRKVIADNIPIKTSLLNSIELSYKSDILTVPGETYPETGLRLVHMEADDFASRELCCGTHLPSTGHVKEFCITLVKGAGGNTPTIYALTGHSALQVQDIWSSTQKLEEIKDMIEPQRMKDEIANLKQKLSILCGTSGAPQGEHAMCVELLDKLKKHAMVKNDLGLQTIAESEMQEQVQEAERQGRKFLVHFLRCSYLMESAFVSAALAPCQRTPTLVLGCANGVIHAACRVPQHYISENFNAERWLSCILPIFKAKLAANNQGHSLMSFAAMVGTKISIINCEQLVQDAMYAATKYADIHAHARRTVQDNGNDTSDENSSQDRRQN